MKTKELTNPEVAVPPSASSPSPRRQRILVVEDHLVVSTGMTALINHESDLQVCGAADDGVSALESIDTLKPDLVLLDITLKGRGGLELLKDIKVRHPRLKVLVLSMHDESLYAMRALRAGASGYLMKGEATETLLVAIRRVSNGDTYLSPRMEKQVMQRLVQRTEQEHGPLDNLSDRELEIFRMIGQGRSTRDISKALFLSIKTIETHRAHIKEKLNLQTGNDLVRRAIEFEQEAGLRLADETSPVSRSDEALPSFLCLTGAKERKADGETAETTAPEIEQP
jgi:DNA-binding NarL/FixJ family response regulator